MRSFISDAHNETIFIGWKLTNIVEDDVKVDVGTVLKQFIN